jgi:radical SAM protein with 4Fe4S-binding SPASM domain
LYNIGQDVKEFINRLVVENINGKEPSADEKETIYYLCSEKIIVPLSKPPSKSILNSINTLRKKQLPKFAWLEVVKACNLKCGFCYIESASRCLEKMSLKDFCFAIAELKKLGVKKIQLIGGEPLLLKDDLKTMVEKCSKDFDFIEIFTNGTLIDKRWCEFFKAHNLHVALSLHSYTPEEHDKTTTVSGSHKKTAGAIKLLQEHAIPHRIATIRSANCNVGKAAPNVGYQLAPNHLILSGRGNISQYDFAMFESMAITKKTMQSPISKKRVVLAVSGHQCFSRVLYISYDLDIYPCPMESRVKYGNLKKEKLPDLINNQLRGCTKDKIEGCKICEYRYACFDCRPNSNGEKIDAKPWYCSYDPKKGKWLDLKKMFSELKTSSE